MKQVDRLTKHERDTLAYMSSMIFQLTEMSRTTRLTFLTYLLEMAAIEARDQTAHHRIHGEAVGGASSHPKIRARSG